MATSGNTHSASSFVPEIIKGAGVWAPGTTVREIEGHFSRENEPQDRVPISETGGVPAVDFSLKDKVKNALPGHHSSSTTGDDTVATTAGGLGTSNHATTGAGSLTGPGDATSFGSGQRATGADQSVERNLGSTSLAAAPATSAGAAAAAGTANNDLTGSSGLTGAHGAHQTPATGTASTATTGATHGISDTAERHLAEGAGAGALGAGALGASSGHHGDAHHSNSAAAAGGHLPEAEPAHIVPVEPGSAVKTAHYEDTLHGAPSGATAGNGGIASELANRSSTGAGAANTTSAGNSGVVGTVNATGASTAPPTSGSHGTTVTNHGNGTTASPAKSTTSSKKKQGLLAKVKKALS